MAARKPAQKKKFFTVDEANASLPLVRAIVQDITALARDLHERQERLTRVNQFGSSRRSWPRLSGRDTACAGRLPARPGAHAGIRS